MNKKPTVEEQLEFFEKILNDDSLCAIVLAALTSPDELEGNKKNQELSLSISKTILENIDKMHFKTDRKRELIRKYFEKVPEIVKQYEEEISDK